MEKTIAFFGELLVRLSPPGRRRIGQTDRLDLHLAGSELNVAAALAGWNEHPTMCSALPPDVLGEWVLARVRQHGIDTSGIIRKEGRQGLFFLEEGQGIRPSAVVYDRQHTALCHVTPADWNWQELLSAMPYFHFSGVTPGISTETAALTRYVVAEAAAANSTISCDLNYRSKLWKYGAAPTEVMPELVEHCHLLLGGPDALEGMLGLPLSDLDYRSKVLTPADLEPIAQRVFDRFPRLRCWAMSLRATQSATDYQWQGYLCSRTEAVSSRSYVLNNCLDRVGTGDAFMAGLLKGSLRGWTMQQTINFAAAAGAFKHYVAGDILIGTEAEINGIADSGNVKINR